MASYDDNMPDLVPSDSESEEEDELERTDGGI